ncbi:MAG TPA: aspartate kinase [Ktedonobacteraceae bacterium]|nr:aspartate kinase [Ktedonobacteraceae bacterium]
MKHAVQVLKFGGTSVGDGERIRRVAAIISAAVGENADTFPVVVVSAMSGVTDQLLRIARLVCAGEDEAGEQELQGLQHKHEDAVTTLVHDIEQQQTLRQDVREAFAGLARDVATLRQFVEQQHELALPTAAVAAWGERLSIRLVAAAVRARGVPAEFVRKEVIITCHPPADITQSFGVVVGAEPLAKETRLHAQSLITPLIERGIVPIAPGFIGRTDTGFVTTLGRNGSDYSATVIGAALDCCEVTIYTDVDGVLTADPRQVPNARLLTHLTYAEAARLSWFGAKVLHPRTLIPIAERNIPVRVRNSFRPHIRGTVVGPVGHMPSGATAITVRHKLALITVERTDLFGAPENAGQVFALAARAGAAPVAICSSSGHHLSFLVEETAASSVIALLQQHMDDNWTVRCRHNLAACACIGSGFTSDPMSPARAKTALARERIPVITEGASEQGVTLIVEDHFSERALRSLHRDLIAPVIPLMKNRVSLRERREAR